MLPRDTLYVMLNEIKNGIDMFNASSESASASYPKEVEIEYEGIKLVVPWGYTTRNPDNQGVIL